MKDQPDILTLSDLCTELKIEPRLARMRLRDAAKDNKAYPSLAKEHSPRLPWRWAAGSKSLNEARKALTGQDGDKS